jgi:hypothetical protein
LKSHNFRRSFLLLLLVVGVESELLYFTPDQFGVFPMYMGSGLFWLLYLVVVVVCLL